MSGWRPYRPLAGAGPPDLKTKKPQLNELVARCGFGSDVMIVAHIAASFSTSSVYSGTLKSRGPGVACVPL
jgi:hypothetical protein